MSAFQPAKEAPLAEASSSPFPAKTGKFPKGARLLTSSHYKFFHRNSRRLLGEQIALDLRQGKPSLAKLGLTVSKKFGKAHDRNRFKRVVREAFRELSRVLPDDLEMNISPRQKGAYPTKQGILLELRTLLGKILPS